ncbi:MFS transporter [Novacetimonas hansenii]|uniref:MFS transporter n=2 Tax=Novacetimonas hansenii TaxID=436 RepID=A0AAW5EUW2_NOVHA|nr:MFS transporter [Novacetimonas hansenii]EFG83402.1 arabinose polymer transporter [Novacetimonas hansenii ATCC 23769]MBL7238032.1 MFS transporter [Novacetimonas hansenii]MCJ8354115.1 MFS transporter [Novacetimonas hansenii]QOF95911.1 MFS transporter [Novacetimonas hansenii]GAN83963.1 major facilitator superfamily arabinose transmembrane efflux protein [Novacetimonas hansenii JCM 7643]
MTEKPTVQAVGTSEAGRASIHPTWIFFILAMGGFAIGTAEFAAMSLVPMISRDMHVTVPQAGHAIIAYAVGVCVGAPLIALLGAKASRKLMLIGMTALYVLGSALTAVAPSFSWLLLFRFISGLPHGAYFGTAGIVAASLVPERQRTQAVARVVLGLTIATIAGVPLANGLGLLLGWRWAFVLIAALAFSTMLLVILFVPADPARPEANALTELRAMRSRQVWLTLGIGVIGFGGIFCVYTYLASILQEVTHAQPFMVPVMLAVFGVGMTVGTMACAWAADRKMMPTIGGTLLVNAAALAGFPGSIHSVWGMMPIVFMIGCGGGLGTVIQSRLLGVAVNAQALAAAMNQSAFNLANAIGPWLGGLAIAAGWGWGSVGWVGCALAMGGFTMWMLSLSDERAATRRKAGG